MNTKKNTVEEPKPFNSQKQLQQHVVDKFAKFGHKVRWNFKLKIQS